MDSQFPNIPTSSPKAKVDSSDSITRFRGPAHFCFIPSYPDAEDEAGCEEPTHPDCSVHDHDNHRGPSWHSISGHLLNLPPSQPITVLLLPSELDIDRYPRPKQHKCCAPVECYDLSFSETLSNETLPTEEPTGTRPLVATTVRRGTVGNVLRDVGGGDAARLSTDLLIGEKFDASDGRPTFTDGKEPKEQRDETIKDDRKESSDTDVRSSEPASKTPLSPQTQSDPPSATDSIKPFFSFTPAVVKTGSAAADHVHRFFPQFEAMMAQEGTEHGWVVCLGEAVLVATNSQICRNV